MLSIRADAGANETLGARLTLSKSIPFKHRWLGTAVLVVSALVSIGVIIFNATTTARHEIDALALVNADQRLWTILEVEEHVIEFQRDLWRVQAVQDQDVDRIRTSFHELEDIVATIRQSPEYQELFTDPTIRTSLTEVERGIAQIAPWLTTSDATLWRQIPVLLQASEQILVSASALCNASLPAFSNLAIQHRNGVAKSLFDLGFIIVLMFWILLVSVVVLLFSLRTGAKRTSEISATRNRLNAIISTSLDGVLVVDRDGRILDFNGAAGRIFGYSQHEAMGQDISELIIPDHLKAAHRDGMTRYLSTKNKKVVDCGLIQLEAKDKSGRIFPVELSISTAESENGQIFVSFIRDISDRVAAEAELVEARDRAVSGERAKANMLAVMSHEMRTPLNGLLGSLQLLHETKLDKRQHKFVDVMTTSGQMLLEHVNNVLDISRVDAGKIEKHEQTFNLIDAVGEVVTSLQAQSSERGNTLSVNMMGDTIAGAFGDKARLTQILVNLAGNAIKFTENGSVTIEVERETGADVVEFRVIDSGIGIPEADAESIFEDFVTLDTSFRREVEGTGLGLGIVKRLVTLLSGQIGVESVEGEGSVFWVRLPLPVALLNQFDPDDGQEADPELTKASVLLVEDNEINRLVAREMLASFGCTTIEACDGIEGVEKAMGQRFDLILCDISMPRLDGIEATKRIRSGSGPNISTPIIALTAHALPSDIARFHEAGMNDVVIKPLTFDEVQRVLGESLGNLRNNQPTDHAQTELTSLLGDAKTRELLARASAELTSGLTNLHAMVSEGEGGQRIKETAHKLAGIAAVAGLTRLHAQLAKVEEASQSSPSHQLEDMVLTARSLMKAA